MTDDDEAFALSIGSMIGGWSEATAEWRNGIRDLQNQVVLHRQGVDAPINLNVVFQVPGNLWAPEFVGVRIGRFRQRDRHLMVQVAIPPGIPDSAPAFLQDALARAIDAAEAWTRRRRIAPDLDAIRGIARLATETRDIAER